MMDLQVVIEGVSDIRIENDLKRKIRKVCKETGRPGEWSILLSPSETRGEWDLSVRGPFGHHVASFTRHVDQLPELVSEELRVCLGAA
jgi:hypothetical protein